MDMRILERETVYVLRRIRVGDLWDNGGKIKRKINISPVNNCEMICDIEINWHNGICVNIFMCQAINEI